MCGIAPSTGISRSRRYSSMLKAASGFVIGESATDVLCNFKHFSRYYEATMDPSDEHPNTQMANSVLTKGKTQLDLNERGPVANSREHKTTEPSTPSGL